MNKIQVWYKSAATFLKEVKIELKKVTWPNRESLKTYTSVVLFVIVMVSAFIGVVDKVFGIFLRMFLKL